MGKGSNFSTGKKARSIKGMETREIQNIEKRNKFVVPRYVVCLFASQCCS